MFAKLKSMAIVIAMALLMAVNYQIFIFENAFAPSGVSGIATMVQFKLGFSVGYMTLIVNIPLCILAFLFLDREFALKTTVFTAVFSAGLLLLRYRIVDLSAFAYKTENGTSTILAPVAAGVINGFIYGTVIRQNACTGGTDVVAALYHKAHPEQEILGVIFVINAAVAIASYFVYDYNVEPVVLCIVYSFLTTRVGDAMIRGFREQVKFEIITRDYDAISKEIITELKHTATLIPAKGMYSGRDTDLLLCVCHKYQVAKLRKIIEKYPGTFATVSAVSDTIGNFKHIRHKLLFEHAEK
ncbi:MAG: YitT family protein [Lachnospiraceae bacterium]|nr:YitT family protein [Lachnospiraceae bacterium]